MRSGTPPQHCRVGMKRREIEQSTLAEKGDWGPRGTAAATIPARLTFEHISHAFGGIDAVDDVSLDIALGEIICLLGPSGCGKTTLLRIAAGVERPAKGRVLLNGEEVAGPRTYVPPERRGVGLMFQDFALFPHLTILENVAFGLSDLSRAQARKEARAALRRVGMSAYESAYPHALSGGEQQRVALARAVVPRPSILLMDEPFSGLDQRLRETVREETLSVLRETGASCLLVTHDPAEAMWMSDRIAVMRDGKLVQVGTPRQIYRHPADADTARFFCEFNELRVFVHGGRADTPLGPIAAAGLAENDHALVMIRPAGLVRTGARTARRGRVVDARYLGETSIVKLAFDGLDAPVTMHFYGPTSPEVGAEIGVKLDPEHVFVFAEA